MPSSLSLIVRLLLVLSFVGILTSVSAKEKDDEHHLESVSFQGQRLGEHFTMQVEEGHEFRCFETKEELVDAVDRYNGYNHIDVEMAEKYGWPIGTSSFFVLLCYAMCVDISLVG
jgi:hypothetical protein